MRSHCMKELLLWITQELYGSLLRYFTTAKKWGREYKKAKYYYKCAAAQADKLAKKILKELKNY